MTIAVLTATKDATMGKQKITGFSGWNGYDDHLQVGGISDWKWRCVVNFPIWQIPAGSTINSVTLRLTYYSTSNPHTVGNTATGLHIARMTADWGVGGTNPGCGNFAGGVEWHWDNRFDKWSKTTAKAKTVTQGAANTTEDISMREIFMEWWEGGRANYGIMLRNGEEGGANKALLFWSGNNETAGRRPELIVDYTSNTPPLAPKNISPAEGTMAGSLTPTFYGELDDVDADDKISAWLIRVIDENASVVWATGKVPVTPTARSLTTFYGSTNPLNNLVPLQAGKTYSWYLVFWDTADNQSPSTPRTYFTVVPPPNVPTVTVNPLPLSAVPSQTPKVSVEHNPGNAAVPDMHAYQIRLNQETTVGAGDWTLLWDTGAIDISSAPKPSVTVPTPTLQWGGSYRVFARTQDASGAWSSWSVALGFVVVKTSVPINLNPAGSTATTATPTLSGSRGSSSDVVNAFSLRVYNDAQTATMLAETRYTATTNGSSFSRLYAGTALTAGQAYRWQAKVESSVGGISDWSALQRFVVQSDVITDTSPPTITSPVGDNSYTLTPTVAMNRANAFDALAYQVFYEAATETNLGTAHYLSPTIAKASSTSYSAAYAGTALQWNTGYKIRAKVSVDGGATWGGWTGLYWFKTASAAGPPVLMDVAGDSADPAWAATSTPAFTIGKNANDAGNITQMAYRIYNAPGTTVIYNSGEVTVTTANTATLTYSGTLLVPGQDYKWDARYLSTTGPWSPFSGKKSFRINAPPYIPTSLFPSQTHAFSTLETKTFKARFSDPESAVFGDYPTSWDIHIVDVNDNLHDQRFITTGLVSGLNSVTWPGAAFTTGVDYRWRTRFRDSKDAWGEYSSWMSFRVAEPPNGTITAPTNGSNISTVTPTLTWTFEGGTQRDYRIDIYRTNDVGTVLAQETTVTGQGTATSVVLPGGFFKNKRYYDITLTVYNTDNMVDPTPSTVNVFVELDAPDPILGVGSIADTDNSNIRISWNTMSLKTGHQFVAYRIYRRRKNLTEWTRVRDIKNIGTGAFRDWYAGNSVGYQYVVRAVTMKTGVGIQMESGDDPEGGSFADTGIESDNWHFIGADRDAKHISILLVTDESHNRPIQQEVFETLGSERKVIMRGFVLGHEGSLTTLWLNRETASPEDVQVDINETYMGRRIVDYLTRNAGPHIIKSPFGDVWESQFASPEYTWLSTGHLEVVLEFIETGTTSEDEY